MVKCFVSKHEGPNLIPRSHVKTKTSKEPNPGTMAHTYNPGRGEMKTGRDPSWGELPRQTNISSSMFSEKLCLKKCDGRILR